MVTFRRLKQADIPEMLRLWKESGLPISPKAREAPRALRVEMRRNPGGFIGAVDVEEIVGVVLATSDGRKGYVNRLAVAASYRRKGLGMKLIRKAERELGSRGIRIVTALIEDDNEASLAMFEKAGYAIRKDIIYVRKELVKDA